MVADDDPIPRSNTLVQITERFTPGGETPPVQGVTARFEPRDGGAQPMDEALRAVTARFSSEGGEGGSPPTQAHEMAALGLRPGDRVAEQLTVMEGPLGQASGEAEIYLCRDEQSQETVVLKIYRFHAAPKREVLEPLLGLVHPGLVSLKTFGIWGGRFYEVMEYCRGGSLADHMPLDEGALLDRWLFNIVEGLHYCHSQNIVHRDVKPSNLFFRQSDRREVVIADFGISSILQADAQQSYRTRAFHFTLDYAAPELLSRNEVGPWTDFYALGITLIHLVTGRSPFQGMHPLQISVSHVQGRVPLPEMSERLARLLSGLLQTDPRQRWGYEQCHQWRQGETVCDAWGHPWKPTPTQNRSHPYPGFPEATTLTELAAHLHRFDAARHLFRGDIRRWVFDHFDPELARRIEVIQENEAAQPELGVWRLRLLLDPHTPLRMGERSITSLASLLKALRQGEDGERVLELFTSGQLEAWVELSPVAGKDLALAGRLRRLRLRLIEVNATPAMERYVLEYLLTGGLPLLSGPYASLLTPAALGEALAGDPGLVRALAVVVKNRLLEARLVAGEYPHWREDGQFLHALLTHVDDELLLAYGAAWRFNPALGFPFLDRHADTPRTLAEWIDASPEATRLGLDLLRRHWLNVWLTASGRMDPLALEQLLEQAGDNQELKLETLLRTLHPDLPPPIVHGSVSALDFKGVNIETGKSLTLEISNQGRGYLHGVLVLEDPALAVSLHETKILGALRTMVTVSTRHLSIHSRHEGRLRVVTNGGELSIPLTYTVTPPWARMIRRSMVAGLVGGGVLMALRLGLTWMEQVLFNQIPHDKLLFNSFGQVLSMLQPQDTGIFFDAPTLVSLGLALLLAVGLPLWGRWLVRS